jgi:signal transduction histidine kinase/ActR/RegA family two-component response regulator
VQSLIPDMDGKMNPLTLAFEGRLEDEFREYHARNSIRAVRLALVAALCFYAALGALDFLFHPEQSGLVIALRYGVVCPAFALAALLTYVPAMERHAQTITAVAFLVAGVVMVLMMTASLAPETAQLAQRPDLLLLLLFIYAFSRLRYIWAVAVAWSVVFAYELAAVVALQMSMYAWIANNVYLIAASVIGMFGSFFIEYHARRDFLHLRLLEDEKRKTERMNHDLEHEVRERERAEASLREHRQRLQDSLETRTGELNDSYERLKKAQKMEAIGALAGGIAHDFNNILAAIMGYATLAADEVNPDGKGPKYMGEVIKASNRAKDLVRQILSFSRQGEAAQEPLQLHLIVKESIKTVQTTAPDTIRIDESVDTKSPPVVVDPTQMHQVIVNLLTNAIYAMRDAGGILSVSLRPESIDKPVQAGEDVLEPGLYTRLAVKDTGCGMDDETASRIFEPFFTTKPAGEGTGLGLATVHRIIQSAGGGVFVRSEPGAGTRFYVYLPAAESATPDESPSSGHETPETPANGAVRVLFVDDEEALVALYEETLARIGYEVTACGDAKEALARFREHPAHFDVVVSDLKMPGMTGDELARKVLQVRPDLPILLTTGYSDSLTPERASELGVREVLVKPVLSPDLARAIQRCMEPETGTAV